MSFEEITIVIALIMLIICFIVVIVMIYNSKGSKAFPVRISRCRRAAPADGRRRRQ